MAICIANRDQKQANETLSDAVGIALLVGVIFGALTYWLAPSILQAMTGAASASIVEPASTYVQIRFFLALNSCQILLDQLSWPTSSQLNVQLCQNLFDLLAKTCLNYASSSACWLDSEKVCRKLSAI